MIDKEDVYRLKSEQMKHQMCSSLTPYAPIIQSAVERGEIQKGPEEKLFLLLGRVFLVTNILEDDENAFFFELDNSLNDRRINELIISCGEVPGSEECKKCTRSCPFRDSDTTTANE